MSLRPLTFSLDYGAVEIYFRLNCFSCQDFLYSLKMFLEFFEVLLSEAP
jgi:hypothetical protein